MQILRAKPEDAPTLTAIAFAAKRHWKYPEHWIEIWRDLLTVSPEFIATHETYAALFDNRIVGFYALVPQTDQPACNEIQTANDISRDGRARHSVRAGSTDTPDSSFPTKSRPSLNLLHLWVLPEFMGRGIGRALFHHSLERTQASGHRELDIESDPNAEGFYLRLGARRVGTKITELDGQRRELPLLIYQITPK